MNNIRFDSHVHVWESLEEKYACDPTFGSLPTLQASPDLLDRTLRANNISYAALIQPGNYGYDASMVADVVAEQPSRYVGLGMVNPADQDVVNQLQYWIETRRLVGMRVLGSMLQDAYFDRFWIEAHRLKATLSFLTGPVDLSPFLQKLGYLPPTKIIFDHFAHRKFDEPTHYQQLLDLAHFPNIYVKLSGLYALSKEPHPHADAAEFIKKVYDTFGPQRLMWASDFPYIIEPCGYSNCLDLFLSGLPFLTSDDIEWICGKTAYQVLIQRD